MRKKSLLQYTLSIRANKEESVEVWHPSKVHLFHNICHVFHTLMKQTHEVSSYFFPLFHTQIMFLYLVQDFHTYLV